MFWSYKYEKIIKKPRVPQQAALNGNKINAILLRVYLYILDLSTYRARIVSTAVTLAFYEKNPIQNVCSDACSNAGLRCSIKSRACAAQIKLNAGIRFNFFDEGLIEIKILRHVFSIEMVHLLN